MEQGTEETSVDLVYSEVRDLLRRQEAKLGEARSRAGTVLAVSAFALSFLGGSILDRHTRPGGWFWIGMILVGISLIAFLWVLIPPPRERLYFSPEPAALLDWYLALTDAEAKEHLSKYMAGWVDENQPEIDPLFTGLRWGTIALGIGIVILLAKLGGLV